MKWARAERKRDSSKNKKKRGGDMGGILTNKGFYGPMLTLGVWELADSENVCFLYLVLFSYGIKYNAYHTL